MTKTEKKRFRETAEALHRQDAPYKKASSSDFLIYLLGVVVIALSIRLFIFEPVQVKGSSMFPTLVDGEGMFVEKLTYTFSAPERGDIVICHYPGWPIDCVKRIIGVEGDTIEISGGALYLNGRLLDESAYWNDFILADMPPVAVPEGSIFVVGDNRNASDDSRSPYVGPIPAACIKGKVQAVFLPFYRARTV